MSDSGISITIDKEDLLCPILQEIMIDPVIAPDGYTYERTGITEWFCRGNNKSPLTGESLSHSIIIDNHFAKRILSKVQNANSHLEQIGLSGIRQNLEKCIKEKEEFIKNLIEKDDHIIIDKDASFDVVIKGLKNNLDPTNKLNVQVKNDYLNQKAKLGEEDARLFKAFDAPKSNQINNEIPFFPAIPSYSKNNHLNDIEYIYPGEIQTLTGHTYGIYCLLKLSKNVIVSGSLDKTIKIWREENGIFKEIQTLNGHTHAVLCLLKVSENVIASGSEDTTIKIWREENGIFKEIQSLTNHTNSIWSLLKLSDNLIASGSGDKTIKLWRGNNGKFKDIKTLSGNDGYVSSLLKVSENVLASGCGDNSIKIWREEKGKFKIIQTLTGHKDYVISLLKVSEKVIASGSWDKTIKLWREDNGEYEEIQTLAGHTGFVHTLLKVSENVIASGSWKTINFWREENGKFQKLQTYEGHTDKVHSLLKISENVIASGSADCTIKFWLFGEI